MIVWLFYYSSAFAVSGVRISGADTVPVATSEQEAAAPIGTPLATVDLRSIADRVRTIPALADAQVTRAWPDKIVIVVTERVPVVVVTDGSRFEFGSRGLATGSRPLITPSPGLQSDGVHLGSDDEVGWGRE